MSGERDLMEFGVHSSNCHIKIKARDRDEMERIHKLIEDGIEEASYDSFEVQREGEGLRLVGGDEVLETYFLDDLGV